MRTPLPIIEACHAGVNSKIARLLSWFATTMSDDLIAMQEGHDVLAEEFAGNATEQ